MKKLTILLLVGIALLLGISPCNAEILQQATDVFEVSDDGQKMQIVTVLEEGTEYELIERVVTQAGSTFDSPIIIRMFPSSGEEFLFGTEMAMCVRDGS